ncbi:Doublecortin [Balamuthia mandrillaris]
MPGIGAIKHNKTVRLVAKNTGQSLRGFPDGHVDGHGKQGPRTQWLVEQADNGTFKFKNIKTGKYLRINKDNKKLDADGTGGPQCRFKVSDKEGFAILESEKLSSHRVGILPSGQPKDAGDVGQGDAARFTVVKVA